nr:reverse transcriptase domain-containing protein [Tanacetum cinerariifolium]
MWKLYTDGASSSDGSGAGLMLISPGGKEYMYVLRFEFETINNEAEYEALLVVQTSGSGISFLLAVVTIFTGSGNALCILFPT